MKASRGMMREALGRIRAYHLKSMADEIPDVVQSAEAAVPGMPEEPGYNDNKAAGGVGDGRDELVIALDDEDDDEKY